MCVYIFSGRFQPFHNGHLEVFNEMCRIMKPNDTLVMGVVSPYQLENLDTVENEAFVEASKEHHLPERNPWDVSIPLSAVSHIIRTKDISGHVVATLIPRPEYGWKIIKEWFPERRVWVVPKAGEEFDEKKAEFFEGVGDGVIRIEDTTGISGRELRDFYYNDDYDQFSKQVPTGLADIYFKDKFDNVEDDFQLRASKYESRSRWVTSKEVIEIPRLFFNNHQIGNMLDAGGGTGFLSHYLYKKLKQKVNTVSLVDISHNMIAIAKAKKEFPVKTYNMSLETFCQATTKQYDSILVRQVLHYVDDVDVAVAALKQILTDKGYIYVGQILVEDEKCEEWHDKLMKSISKNRKRTFTRIGFESIFIRNGFDIVQSDYQEYEENLNDLFQRRAKVYMKSDSTSLLNTMISYAADDVKNTMKIRIDGNNLFFTVKFCHLFLRKKQV